MTSGNKKLHFDLVSDLHADKWQDDPDWQKLKTSDLVIVAGDVAATIDEVKKELTRLSAAYDTVLYLDGNHEYYEALALENCPDLTVTEDRLRLVAAGLPNVHYLKDAVFIRDGVAIIGRNGFWDHQFGETITVEQGEKALADKWGVSAEDIKTFTRQAQKDFEELRDEVRRLGDDPSIHTIIVVTHTVPHKDLVFEKLKKRSPEGAGYAGNSQMEKVLKEDKNKKIKFWLFGHVHTGQEKKIDHVEYISSPRGVPVWGTKNYKPKQIDAEASPRAPEVKNAPKPKGPELN